METSQIYAYKHTGDKNYRYIYQKDEECIQVVGSNTTNITHRKKEGESFSDFVTRIHEGAKNYIGSNWGGKPKGDLIAFSSIPGTYYPRIYRPDMSNTLTFTEQINESVKTAQILLKKLLALFEIVDSSANIKSIFGHEIRNLLILACTEVESSWKAILNRNNATSARDTKDYFNLHNALHLDRYLVHFTLHPALTNISPFSEWNGNQTTQSLSWYHAYNTTKHNREEHLADANLDHCVSAISAILILLQSQFGPGQSFWKQGDFLNVSVIMDYDWKAEEHYLPTFFIKPAKPNWQERLFLFSA